MKSFDGMWPALMQEVEDKIVVVRGQRTLLDRDVAALRSNLLTLEALRSNNSTLEPVDRNAEDKEKVMKSLSFTY